jgi:histidine kinase/DNA gyrase B/HSP90-like ATPase
MSPASHVDASPTKQFFVEMLVRDIELAPAIIDLLDNSVDGAKRFRAVAVASSDDAPFAGLKVQLSINAKRFEIEDNCGGIDPETARTYAFRFGRPDGMGATRGEVGQFGVGMKRALFKIGRRFHVASNSDKGRFRVDVDVDDWVGKPKDWTFPMATLAKGDRPATHGTRLLVDKLHGSVKSAFALDSFLARVKAQIEMRHAIAMEHGLEITLNGARLSPRAPVLLLGDDIKPLVRERQITINGDSISMELYAGFVSLRDEDADTDDPEKFKGSSLSGWYLFCNDRMLVWADRGRLTGWGEEVARYHPQYRRFRGYVLLNGEAKYMPWNTAKTQVDEDSVVWQTVRNEMVDALRQSVKAMNRIKREVEQRPANDRPLVRALKNATPVRLSQLPQSRALDVPPTPKRISADTTTIRYAVPTSDFTRVADHLEVTDAADVGRATFRYYLRRETDA